jgi:hypothetical protein
MNLSFPQLMPLHNSKTPRNLSSEIVCLTDFRLLPEPGPVDDGVSASSGVKVEAVKPDRMEPIIRLVASGRIVPHLAPACSPRTQIR